MKANIDYQHVLLTRFNLATGGRETGLRNRPGWLARRFDLFETYCLPSLAAQTNDDFTWLIFFDEGTPEPFRQRIAEAQRQVPFRAVFLDEAEIPAWISQILPHAIQSADGERPPWLLTSRLDNDDGLAIDYVSRLHENLAALDHPVAGARNFPNGFVLHEGRLYAHTHRSNAFASWLGPFEDGARTVFDIQHMALVDHGPIHQIGGPGAWLQVIHGENVSNKVRGRLIGPAEAEDRFPPRVIAELTEAAASQIRFDNTFLAPLRSLRDKLFILVKRLLGRR